MATRFVGGLVIRANPGGDLRAVLRGTGIGFLGNISAGSLLLVHALVLARGVGADATGVFFLWLAVGNVATTLFGGGLSQAARHFVPQFGRGTFVVRTVHRTQLGVLAGALPILALVAVSLPDPYLRIEQSRAPFFLVLCAAPIVAWVQMRAGVYQAHSAFSRAVVVQKILMPASRVAILLSLLGLGQGLMAPAAALALSALVAALASIAPSPAAALSGGATGAVRAVQSPTPLAILRFSVPAMFAELGGLSAMTAYPILLGAMGTSHELAMYGTAFRVMLPIALARAALADAFGPTAARFSAAGEEADLAALYRATRIRLTLIMGAPAALLLIFAEQITAVFGPEFAGAALPLRILVAGQMVALLVGPAGQRLLQSGRSSAHMTIGLLSNAIGIVIAVLLIPEFGVAGAALGTAVGTILDVVVQAAFYRRAIQSF